MESTQILTSPGGDERKNLDCDAPIATLTVNGVVHFIRKGETTIGRDAECTIVLNNKAVSSEHAVIEADHGSHYIRDLGSTNKTKLGEIQLKPRVTYSIIDGARLRIADVSAVYNYLKIDIPQSPQLATQPIALDEIPGTPEKRDEPVVSIVTETPHKEGEEDDITSDGDIFGDQLDSTSMFVRPLRVSSDVDSPLSAANGNTNPSPTAAPTEFGKGSFASVPAAQSITEVAPPEGDAVNETSAGETDLSDLVPGSQPMLTPPKNQGCVNIFDLDTEPVARVLETPDKREINWDNIDEELDEIGHKMDSIDSLIENNALKVSFTPPKKSVLSNEREVPSDITNPEPSCVEKSDDRSDCNFAVPASKSDSPISSKDIFGVSSSKNILESKNIPEDTALFEMATQQFAGSESVEQLDEEMEATSSVFDMATQPYFSSKSDPNEAGSGGPASNGGHSDGEECRENVANISLSDIPTQAKHDSKNALELTSECKDQAEAMLPQPKDLELGVSISDMLTQVKTCDKNVPNDNLKPVVQDSEVSASHRIEPLDRGVPADQSMPDILAQTSRERRSSEDSETVRGGEVMLNVGESDRVESKKVGIGTEPQDPSAYSSVKADVVSVDSKCNGKNDPTREKAVVPLDVSLSELATQPNFSLGEPPGEKELAEQSISGMMTQAVPDEGRSEIAEEEPNCQEEGALMVSDVASNPSSPVDCGNEMGDQSISDMMTQAVPGRTRLDGEESASRTEPAVLDISVSDLATQPNFSVDRHSRAENLADQSISEIMTQAVPDDTRSDGTFKEPAARTELAVLEVSEKDTDDKSIFDVMTEAVSDEVIKKPVRRNEPPVVHVNVSDLAVQPNSPLERHKEDDLAKAEKDVSDMITQAVPDRAELDGTIKKSICGGKQAMDVSLSDLATQPVTDHSLSDMMTQAVPDKNKEDGVCDLGIGSGKICVANESKSGAVEQAVHAKRNSPKISEDTLLVNVSISELATQPNGAVRSPPDSTEDFGVSSTQISSKVEVSSISLNVSVADKLLHATNAPSVSVRVAQDILDAETQPLAIEHDKVKDSKSVPDEIYDMMTQIPVGNNQIFCEESDTQAIHAEIEKFETSVVDAALREITSVMGQDPSANKQDKKSADEPKTVEKEGASSLKIPSTPVSKGSDELCSLSDPHDSVEDRIRAMNDKNVSSQVLPGQALHKKTTVAELLETLEGTQSPIVRQRKDAKSVKLSDSETTHSSNYLESQDVGRQVRRRAIKIQSSDEEGSSEHKEDSDDEKTEATSQSVLDKSEASKTDEPKLTENEKYGKTRKEVANNSKGDEEDVDKSFQLNVSEDPVSISRSESAITPPVLPKDDHESTSPTKSVTSQQKTPPKSASNDEANASSETPEIPNDFFGTPLNFQKPPVLRQYVNRKKLSLRMPAESPKASSTPIIESESRNVKKFKKSSPKKRPVEVELFSQDSETLSSQDESDSIDLGRGKRKRVKKSFYGFDDDGTARRSHPSDGRVSNTDEEPEAEDASEEPTMRIERPRKQAFMARPHSDEARQISSVVESNVPSARKDKQADEDVNIETEVVTPRGPRKRGVAKEEESKNSQRVTNQAGMKEEAGPSRVVPPPSLTDDHSLKKKGKLVTPDQDHSKNSIEPVKRRGRPPRTSSQDVENLGTPADDDSSLSSQGTKAKSSKVLPDEAARLRSVSPEVREPPKKRGRPRRNTSSQDVGSLGVSKQENTSSMSSQEPEAGPSVVRSDEAAVRLRNPLPDGAEPTKKRGRPRKNVSSQEIGVLEVSETGKTSLVSSPGTKAKFNNLRPNETTARLENATPEVPAKRRGRPPRNVSSQESGSSEVSKTGGKLVSSQKIEASTSKVCPDRSTAISPTGTPEVKEPVKRRGRPPRNTSGMGSQSVEASKRAKQIFSSGETETKQNQIVSPEAVITSASVTPLMNESIKKRGRPPRKPSSQVSSDQETDPQSGQSEVAPKLKTATPQMIEPPKKRGRPSRNTTATSRSQTPASEEPVTPVRRGRKPGNKNVMKNEGESSATSNLDDGTLSLSNVDSSRYNRKTVDMTVETGANDSQDSQGRRSGRARKKKETFDEIMLRKEEEIRLKKQLRALESSPDKSTSPSAAGRVPPANDRVDSVSSASPVPSTSSTKSARGGARYTSAPATPSSGSSKRKIDSLEVSSNAPTKVMFTGLADAKLSGIVKKLGGKVVVKPQDCTVLVTDQVRRTVKFLCALGLGTPIVSPNWLSKSKAFNAFANPEESLLVDPDAEAKFDFKLSSSLEKARDSRLLEGYTFHATPSVLPTPQEIKPIVECSGGTYVAKPPAKWPAQSFVVSCPKDKALWAKMTKAGLRPGVISAEALLSGILQQRFDPDKYTLS